MPSVVAVEGHRADAAGTEVRPDRWADEVDRHIRRVDPTWDAANDLLGERLHLRVRGVEDRQALHRARADELHEPLTSLGPRPDALDNLDLTEEMQEFSTLILDEEGDELDDEDDHKSQLN